MSEGWSKPWKEGKKMRYFFWFVYVPIVAILFGATAAGEFYTALHLGYDPLTNPNSGIFIFNHNGNYTVTYEGHTLPVTGTLPFNSTLIPNGQCIRFLASIDFTHFSANARIEKADPIDCHAISP